jgi:hypothetical protein
MPKLPEAFDATQHEVRQAFDPLPAGWYNVAVTGSDTFLTKSGTECLKLELTVLDGEHVNRKLWENLNLWHTNPTAVQIAQQTLAAICTSINRTRIGDTEELHGQPLQAKVAVETDPTYGSRNAIKGWRAADGKVTPIQQPAATSAPAAQAAKTPPWLKRS